MGQPDVIVAWLQNDYGQLGRPAEAIAHALIDEGLAGRVAFVQPNARPSGDAVLDRTQVRGVDVYRLVGAGVDPDEYARAVIATSQLTRPILLNCGVGDANWWFHAAFAPHCSRTVLVTHDILHLWPGVDAEIAERWSRIRRLLVQGSDEIVGLSTGSISDIEDATYVGHGHDAIWSDPEIDRVDEPGDLARIPHPRALYYGALSTRIEVRAMRLLADAGVHVVIVGFAPAPDVAALIDKHPKVHFLGPRTPEESAGYLLYSDIGIVPHTDEPFTASMEPHKLYNYASAGLRSVALNCVVPPSLDACVASTRDASSFVAACWDALDARRLGPSEIARVRSISWSDVTHRLIRAVA